MEIYTILPGTEDNGKVTVRRASDGKAARCKLAWLEKVAGTESYRARSETKALRMDGLEWTEEA